MAKKQASAEPRRSLLEVAKAAGCETGTILDVLDAESRAELLQVAKGVLDGSITAPKARIVSALQDAGVPITKSKLDTLIDNIKLGAIK